MLKVVQKYLEVKFMQKEAVAVARSPRAMPNNYSIGGFLWTFGVFLNFLSKRFVCSSNNEAIIEYLKWDLRISQNYIKFRVNFVKSLYQ